MKSVIMIGGGVQEAPAVHRIQKLGYEVIVTDRNPHAPAFRMLTLN
jgi:formate-dependent phosphoribosylglycinamide formyltransferase (GAR transformylase)